VNSGVRLERAQIGHGDRTGSAYAAEIVPREIDDHHVFGPIFRLRRRLSAAARSTAMSPPAERSLDGPRFRLSGSHPQETLGDELTIAPVSVSMKAANGAGLTRRGSRKSLDRLSR